MHPKKKKMLNHKHNDSSVFSKTPRKIDYPEKEYQSVIDRARLTLFNLTDIWKSKTDSNKVNKSCESIAVNRKALDVLTVWSRHRRSPSVEIGASPKSSKRSLFIENGDGERWRLDNKQCVKLSHSKSKSKSDRGKHKSKHSIDSLVRGSGMQGRRRSFDGGLNHFSFDNKADFRLSSSQRGRLSSWESLIDDNGNAYESQLDSFKSDYATKKPSTIVKTHSKFKKTNTCDDLYVNVANKQKPFKVLKRQTSVVPIITVNDCDSEHSNKDLIKNPDDILIEPTDKSMKPRKKLSFREPIILSEKVKELREKHSEKAESNLKKEEVSSIESLDQV